MSDPQELLTQFCRKGLQLPRSLTRASSLGAEVGVLLLYELSKLSSGGRQAFKRAQPDGLTDILQL